MLVTALLSLSALVAGSLLSAPVALAEAPCPNEAFRTGYSARLPDCRAYERVSPPGVEPFYQTEGSAGNLVGPGIRALGEIGESEASLSGERLLFFSPYGLPGASSDGFFFLSTRGPAGWSTENVIPPQSVSNNEAGCTNAYFPLTSPELSGWVFADGFGQGRREEFNQSYITENFCPT
ncbi:MAG TPA: hypothetical protein VK721_12960, partial [Solirubrobacteraceae bacterium]|nr:hypothetical protein [Solirubrobacteraceae bacterium]